MRPYHRAFWRVDSARTTLAAHGFMSSSMQPVMKHMRRNISLGWKPDAKRSNTEYTHGPRATVMLAMLVMTPMQVISMLDGGWQAHKKCRRSTTISVGLYFAGEPCCSTTCSYGFGDRSCMDASQSPSTAMTVCWSNQICFVLAA